MMSVSPRTRTTGADLAPRGDSTVTGRRAGSVALVLAGIGFVLYPAIRPFSDEASLQGARAFGSTAWIWAHSLAIVAFILLSLALLPALLALTWSASPRLALLAVALSWAGVGLTLPYYGAEVFGLHAVGQAALRDQDPAAMSIVDSIRWEEGIWFILIGLALLAAGAIVLAVAVWRSGLGTRWAAVPLAVALALFIPQFAASQPVRIAYGVLLLIGCAVFAGWLARLDPAEARDDR